MAKPDNVDTPTLVVLVHDPKTGRVSVNGGEWQKSSGKGVKGPENGDDPYAPPEGGDTYRCLRCRVHSDHQCTTHVWTGVQWWCLGSPCPVCV